ncbi:MAG: ammonium transporter [Spirochaetales bacterium]|nr:ammonium transporter [Spirochaetales bacterium]
MDGKTMSPGVVTSAYAYSINDGDTAWLLISAAIVLMMTIPGLALFYGGMVRRKNILATIYYSLGSVLVVSVLWVIVQYTLGFRGFGNNGVWGDLSAFMHNGVLFATGHGQNTQPWHGAPTIPESVYSMFQLMFAIITVALISGAIVERMSITAWLIFSAVWSLIVYMPLSHMVWAGGWLANPNGLASLFGSAAVANGQGAIDFAGGLVVHTSSGISALVLALMLGPRVRYGKDPIIPNNIAFTFLGAALLWVGWFGFNAGSATSAGTLAGSAFFVTNTATAMAGLTWAIIEYIHHKKPTVIGAVTGAVAGLVAITPASGYVDATGALFIGIIVAIVCYMSVAFLKKALGYDDALDTFGVHAVGGMTGALLTGVFCNPDIGAYFSGKPVQGVFYSGNWTQLGIQAASVLVAVLIAVVGTILSYGITRIFTKVRVEPQEEVTGLDQCLLGEKQGER